MNSSVNEGAAATEGADSKAKADHASTTIIEHIANFRRGYMAWRARRAAAVAGQEPAIDRAAEDSWRAR